MSRASAIRQLASAAVRAYPGEAASRLDRLTAREVAEFLERQEPALAADVVRRARSDRAAGIIDVLREPAASAILATLEPAVAAILVSQLDDAARGARLATLEPRLAADLADLMRYPPGVAGAIMDPRVTSFRPETPAREALSRIRALKNKSIHDVFIVDDEARLTGSVSIQDLALAEPGARLEDLAQATPPRVEALAPQEELVAIASDRRLTSLPVVDITNRLLGVIRYADLLRATQREEIGRAHV